LLADAGEAADLAPHTVKKVFGGEEAGVERNSGKYTAEEDTEAKRIGGTVTESGNNPLYEMRAKIFGNLCHNATKIFKALCGQMSPSRGFPLSAHPPINK
jgi:hypothetical protein